MHHLSPLLDLLHALGAASWQTLWLPVLLWTSVVLIAVATLRLTPSLPPLWTYRFRQALLAALPVGIITSAVVDLPLHALPNASVSASALATTTLPTATVAPGTVPLTWTHAVGFLTVLAAVAAGRALSKLSIQIVRTQLMTASVRQHQRDACGPEHTRLEQRTDALRSRLGVRRSAQPVFTEEADSPMLLPGRPALVVLPAWMCENADGHAEENGHAHEDMQAAADAEDPPPLDMSIAHELVHLSRYDDWAALAEQCVASLAAIHPLVHLLIHDIQFSRETACDAAVLSALRCRRGSYARLLADVATRQRTIPGVALSESTSSLEQRLRAMTFSNPNDSHPNASSPLHRILSLGIFAVLIVGMVACADSPSSTDMSQATATTQTGESSEVPADLVTPDEMKSEAFQNPGPVGGMQALIQNVSYPETAAQQRVQGRVILKFIVLENGNLQDVEVTRGVSPELDAEAVRALKQTSFEPGTMDGEPVPARMALPVTFQLPDEG